MSTVVVVSEESHGTIGVATSMTAAKCFLLANNWVTAYTTLYVREREDEDEGHWSFLIDLYGENWKEAYMNFDADHLADMGFYLREEEVYEEEN